MYNFKAKFLQNSFHRFIAWFWLISVLGEIGLGFLYNPNIHLPIAEQSYPLVTVISVIVIGTLHLLLLLGCYHAKFLKFSLVRILVALLISIGFMYFAIFTLLVNFHSAPSLGSWLIWEMGICGSIFCLFCYKLFQKMVKALVKKSP